MQNKQKFFAYFAPCHFPKSEWVVDAKPRWCHIDQREISQERLLESKVT
jgi:hypothetical protein